MITVTLHSQTLDGAESVAGNRTCPQAIRHPGPAVPVGTILRIRSGQMDAVTLPRLVLPALVSRLIIATDPFRAVGQSATKE